MVIVGDGDVVVDVDAVDVDVDVDVLGSGGLVVDVVIFGADRVFERLLDVKNVENLGVPL